MCGTAFSGKTTLSKKIAQRTSFSRISFDEINEKKGYFPGDDIPQNVWAKTSEEAVLDNYLRSSITTFASGLKGFVLMATENR